MELTGCTPPPSPNHPSITYWERETGKAKWGSRVGVWGTSPADMLPVASSQSDTQTDTDPVYPSLLSNLHALPAVDPQAASS